MRVPVDGGTPEVIARVQPTELAASPQMLPGGDALLFTVATVGAGQDAWDRARIVVQRLGSGERTTLVDGASEGRYVSTGHLVFAIGGILFARPFNLGRLQVDGPQVAVLEGVRRGSGTGSTSITLNAMQAAISDSGTLVYVPGPLVSSSRQMFVLTDNKGNVTPLKLPPGPYQFPRVSPDGKQIAYGTEDGKEAIDWMYGLDGNTQPRRLTFEGRNRFPIWSGDGQWVAFQSDREGDLAIFRQRADGSTAAAERLTRPENEAVHVPESWSPKGDTLLFTETKGDTVSLQALALAERKATPFAGIVSNRWPNASFSPDGTWVAYSARRENEVQETLYVRRFPPTESVFQISTGDAHFPVWSLDGRLLFIDAARTDNGRVGFVSVNISTQRGFEVGDPVLIPRRFNVTSGGIGRSRTFDVLPDGQRFIGITGEEALQEGQPSEPQIQVVLNWIEELKQRVPTGR
jgi:Tol biopolymer transport system component